MSAILHSGLAHISMVRPYEGDDLLAHWFVKSLTIRIFEQSLAALFTKGAISGTMHLSIGQEITSVVLADHLRPTDTLCASHRGHAALLSVTDDYEGLLHELLGLSRMVTGGRGGSQHLCVPGRFYSNGVLGGMAPVAAGLAKGFQHDRAGNVAVLMLGDGALGQGVVYETLNLAALLALPLIVIVENNGISQSTPIKRHLAGTIAARFAAFGIEFAEVKAHDFARLDVMMAKAVAAARAGFGPRGMIVQTSRRCGHSVNGSDPGPELDGIDPIDALEAALPPSDRAECRRVAVERIDRCLGTIRASPPAAAACAS